MAFRNVNLHTDDAGGDAIAVLVIEQPGAGSELLDDTLGAQFKLRVQRTQLNAEDLRSRIETTQPDVLLIDCASSPRCDDGVALLRSLRKDFPALKSILYISGVDMDLSVTAFQAGARGILAGERQSAETVAKCIRCVFEGQIWISNDVLVEVIKAFSKSPPLASFPARQSSQLSPREHEVMTLVIQGMSNREIAEVLRVTENTVKKYVYEVFNKTGASNRVELVLQALRSDVAA